MDGAEPSIDNRARVIGADDRFQVQDASAYPWRCIGQIRATWDAQTFTGTGALVGPDQVLTAAHCVYRAELGGWARTVTFTPARQGRSQPFGSAGAAHFAMPRGYAERQAERYDVALITLTQPIGDVAGWLPVASETAGGMGEGATLYSAGYPADMAGGAMYSVAGSLAAVQSSRPGLWTIDLDAAVGQSGSPIWVYDSAGTQATIVAVLVAELDGVAANLAVPVTAAILDQLRAGATDGVSAEQTPSGASAVLVGEPGGDSLLAAAPIVGCGAGLAPAVVLSMLLLAGCRTAVVPRLRR